MHFPINLCKKPETEKEWQGVGQSVFQQSIMPKRKLIPI